MPVHQVLLFAGLKEMIGSPSIEVEVPDGATVHALCAEVAERYPSVASLLAATVCAVNEEYVEGSYTLSESDTVALIPPVSGGAPRGRR